MKPFRRITRIVGAIFALAGILFMQCVLPAHACPVAMGQMEMDMPAASVEGDASPCDMDAAKLALCHAHCAQGSQSVDKAEAPVFVPVMALGALSAAFSVEPAALRSFAAPQSPHLAHSSGPPLSVLHCCFRI